MTPRILKLFGASSSCEARPEIQPAGSLREFYALNLRSDYYRDMAGLPRLKPGAMSPPRVDVWPYVAAVAVAALLAIGFLWLFLSGAIAP